MIGHQYTLPKTKYGVNTDTKTTFGNDNSIANTRYGNDSGESNEQYTEPEKKSFGQKSGEWLANNGSVIRGGINFGMNMLMKPAEATLKRTANIINPTIGINQSNKQDMLNSNAKNYNSFVRNNQSTDQVTNMLTSKIGTADKNTADNQIHLKDSDAYQQSYKDFTAAKNSEQKEKDLFENNLSISQAKAKDLRQDQIKNSVNDFGNILHQQAVQNYQNRSENQTKRDEGNSLLKRLETEKSTRLRNEGNLATLNSDIEKTNSYITTTEAENKKIELNPNKTQEDITKYGENQANLAIAKASLDPHKGSLYKKWNDVNLQGKNQADEDKIAEIKRYLSRIGKGTYKQGGSLSLEEKKDLESYKSNLKENRDAKRDKVKDLRESLKESKLLAKEIYKSSKEDKKEGTKLIMDFYKSIKNK